MKGQAIHYTQEQLAFVKDNSKLPRRELTEKYNQHFSTNIKQTTLAALCKRNNWLTGRTGKIEKGNTPWNKNTKGIMKSNSGTWQKGRTPHNSVSIGSERITKDGYTEIKTQEPNVFELKHRVIWQQHRGEIPEGIIIRFKDSNKQNTEIDNLFSSTRKQSIALNRLGYTDQPEELKKSVRLVAELMVV